MTDSAVDHAQRATLRRRYRRVRRALTVNEQQTHASAVARHLTNAPLFWSGNTFASYHAQDGEVELHPFHRVVAAAAKIVALPVIEPLSERLTFYEHHPGEELLPGRFGIATPPLSAPFVHRLAVDVVLAPLVAFDATGTRLGMGGGYYDRWLALFPNMMRPKIVGVAHCCQQSPDPLPHAPWDIRLDAVVTESGLEWFRPY